MLWILNSQLRCNLYSFSQGGLCKNGAVCLARQSALFTQSPMFTTAVNISPPVNMGPLRGLMFGVQKPMAYDIETRTKFLDLVNKGWKTSAAAAKVGVSRHTGWRWAEGIMGANHAEVNRRRAMDLPAPKAFSELDGAVKDLLKPEGFGEFVRAFFSTDVVPWQVDAAKRVVDALVTPKREYGVMNEPPGSGKTTFFTFLIPVWLLAGGGFEDPRKGRNYRIMLGHEVNNVAEDYVGRMRSALEMRRPWVNLDTDEEADLILAQEFGRFEPMVSEGDQRVWSQKKFFVARVGGLDIYEKEPNVQAASYKGGFIGQRVDLAVWDDLVGPENARSPDQMDKMAEWLRQLAEKRIEPNGLFLLVGQRLSSVDIYRKALDKTWAPGGGEEVQKYFHVAYPVHHEPTCDGEHRQWDALPQGDGCVLDMKRFPWEDIEQAMAEPDYRTVMQQEDADPERRLVLPEWLSGESDWLGYTGPGCYDEERDFWEHPKGVSGLVDYATVDPAAGNWWSIQWWAVQPETEHRYLIGGFRRRLPAGTSAGLLDWNERKLEHEGLMDELQRASVAAGHPIRVWVIEGNAAHKYLFQFNHFRTWREKWWGVTVIPHETQRNKLDPDLGVEGALKTPYRLGLKHLPRKRGNPEHLNFIKVFIKELTTWPDSETDDMVMGDWFGEHNMDRIKAIARRFNKPSMPELHLPPYLEAQRMEMNYAG